MEYDMRKLHGVLVEILDYFVSVCEKYDLRYVLAYGTALGAYRHQGFIPWDDDLDVAMPRKDYEKLREVLAKDPDPRYELQNESNEERWFLTFSKIRKNDTVFLESIAGDRYRNNGIYIDIFPLDNVKDPDSKKHRRDVRTIKYLRHSLKFCACGGLYREKYSGLRYAMECVLTLPVRIAGEKRTLRKLNALRTGACSEKDAAVLAEYDEPQANTVPAEVYFPTRKLLFEGKCYHVPGKIEQYLSTVYGPDYMELPPVEKRQTHKPAKLVF